MKYGYYPGCSLEGISVEYDQSMRGLLDQLDMPIEDLEDWICCGTLAAPSMSPLLGMATPLWNLVRAKEQGFEQVLAPCSACVYHFKSALHKVSDNSALVAEVEAVLDEPLGAPADALHPLEVLSDQDFEPRIKERLKPERDLSSLRAVCYYGCHISRPAEVMQFDDPENPQSMDQLMGWLDIQVLEWSGKVDCCGAHFSLIKPDIVVDLSQQIFAAALEVDAEAIIVACPMCHANLDTRQSEINRALDRSTEIPILYFSQVLGFAMGLSPEELGFRKHLVDPTPLLLEKSARSKAHRTPA